MSEQETRGIVLDVLGRIAPEMEPAEIDADAPFRDQLDLDSMDFLNFMIALHERLGVDIPEADYPKFSTLNDAVFYLESCRSDGSG